MIRKLTPQSTLENLKREAKHWLKALRANEADARARLERALPTAPALPSLRDVQHALAREHGAVGWTTLKDQLAGDAGVRKSETDRVVRFLENACPDHHVRGGPAHVMARHTAMRILRKNPEIARHSLYTATVCGDVEEVERLLRERPQAASEKSSAPGRDRAGAGEAGDLFKDIGPKGWEPLLYLCFTRLPLAEVNDNAVSIARMLLVNGADPNVYFMASDSRYTPLVGVIGEGEEDRPPHPQRDALTRLLLDRGAEPYDIQVIYNIHFHGDVLWFLELMYAHSVKLGRKADWDDPSWSMLDMGGYGNGARWHLGIAVKKNDIKLAEWLLAHGADPNAAPPRDERLSKRTLHEDALRAGFTEIADALVRYGATPVAVELTGEEDFAAACFKADREKAMALFERHPEYLSSPVVMLAAAKHDRVDVVAFLLDLGMSPEVEDGQRQRPLHVAAYAGSLAVAKLLIDRGAEVDPVELQWNNTPLDFAVYAQNARMIDLISVYSRDIWNLTFTGNAERLREVLAAQTDLAKVKSRSGETPLMWLPEDEDRAIEIAGLLITNGADPALRSTKGMSAADFASRRGLDEVAELLRSREGG
ncbi:MAG: ankyrin repeat domain-containing protein [Anaerolineae bacterium]|nr:ankyrin repeat domain-containing protein [Gemmatimonadaceae bacterium]